MDKNDQSGHNLADLPKDIVQHTAKFIENTPEAWRTLQELFTNSQQAVVAKRKEIENTHVWIELHESDIGDESGLYIWGVHMENPKTCMNFRTTVGIFFNVIRNQKPLPVGEY